MTVRCTLTRTASLALVMLATLAPIAAASTGAKPDLAIRSVTAPRSGTPGAPLGIALSVAHRGRPVAATIGVFLSRDRVRDRTDTRLAGSARVPAAGPGAGVMQIPVQVGLPGGQAPGTYFLIACVDDANRIRERNEHNNCRAAAHPLTLTATPVSSAQLLAAAVAAHKLTPQQALVYRVFAAFGDPRVPSAYVGDDRGPDDLVMRAAADAWPTLSAAQKRQLRPFFTPPVVSGSWFSPRASAAGGKIDVAPLVQPSCSTGPMRRADWYSLAKPGGHVRLWWLKSDDERIGSKVRPLVYEIENTIWPKLHALMGREPLSDAGEPCFHGGDGRLDIYLFRFNHDSAFTPRALTFPYPPECTGAPTFIVFDVWSDPPSRWEVAHELMHSFQYAFRYRAKCDSYSNWDETTATWAAQYVYPHDDVEHFYDVWWPDEPLTDASYYGWTFPYAMEKLHGADTIAATYRQAERLPVAQAIDAGMPGGLAKTWPEFALKAWNDDSVAPSFKQWDSFDVQPPGPTPPPQPVPTETFGPTPGYDRKEIPRNLPPLTRSYRHFSIGLDASQIVVFMRDVPGIRVDAIEQFRDHTTKVEQWTKGDDGPFPGQVICQPDPAKRLADLVLVISNSSLTQTGPADQPIKMLAMHAGCEQYTGTASGHYSLQYPQHDRDETWTASGLVFKRSPVSPWEFDLAGGLVTWSMTGTQDSCSLHGGPMTFPVVPGPSGGQLGVGPDSIGQRPATYSLWASGLPLVNVTMTCPWGTSQYQYRPHYFIATGSQSATGQLTPDGVIQGTATADDRGAGGSVYSYHLVPDP